MTAGVRSGGPTSLAQIVAALSSVSYTDAGVAIWLTARNASLGQSTPIDFVKEGRITEVADAVRRIGDADPADFTITDRSIDHA